MRCFPLIKICSLVCCLLLVGCAKENKRVTKQNFDQLKPGMTLKAVQEILGEEAEGGGDGSNVAGQFGVDVGGGGSAPPADYMWQNGTKKIIVTFKKGVLVSKKSEGI